MARNLSPEEKKAWILENCIDKDGDIDLRNLDFSDQDAHVYLSGMKTAKNLIQNYQEAGWSISQDHQNTKKFLFQGHQYVVKDLFQDRNFIKGDLQFGNDVIGGKMIMVRKSENNPAFLPTQMKRWRSEHTIPKVRKMRAKNEKGK